MIHRSSFETSLGLVVAALLAAGCSAGITPEQTAASTTATVAPSTTVRSTTIASTTTVPRQTTTTTEPPRLWNGLDRLNVLLLGSDAGVGRTGTRTDTLILLSIEPESGDLALISIPRNLTEAPLPEGMGIWDCDCFPDIITHLWANGEWYPDAFSGPQQPSVNALKAAVGGIFDLEVHYYAKVELAGFVDLFDALGGVTVDVPKRIVDVEYPHEDGGSESVVIDVGRQHLDGHHALVYARSRRQSGDFARMHRQRCILGALVEQARARVLDRGFDNFVAAVVSNVETDIPIESLGDFIDVIPRLDTERMGTLRITRYNYGATGHAGYQLYDLDRIEEDARALIADPTTVLETQDGVGLEDICAQSFD